MAAYCRYVHCIFAVIILQNFRCDDLVIVALPFFFQMCNVVLARVVVVVVFGSVVVVVPSTLEHHTAESVAKKFQSQEVESCT